MFFSLQYIEQLGIYGFSCLYIRIYYGIYFLDTTPAVISRSCERALEPARKNGHEARDFHSAKVEISMSQRDR